jgi:hypothetical protein
VQGDGLSPTDAGCDGGNAAVLGKKRIASNAGDTRFGLHRPQGRLQGPFLLHDRANEGGRVERGEVGREGAREGGRERGREGGAGGGRREGGQLHLLRIFSCSISSVVALHTRLASQSSH